MTGWKPIPRRLRFLVLDDSPALVIATFWADRVSWNGDTALRAVADLTTFDPMMGASFSSTAIGMFAFGDSHCWVVRI